MQIEHLNKETTDGTVRNLDALYQLFPSCFTEAQDAVSGDMRRVVDWGKLRELLGEYVEDGEPEKYDFTWVGKRAAQREAAAPCRKTLRPCPKESVDWDNTQNLYIEGDNLEVLKLLQNSYMGKVKMIYIDPPYNTGNDFVYHDDFAQSAEEYDEHNLDDEGNRFRKNTDSNGRFHSDWCSMIYARLMVARSLLTEDGVIFISIDENEIQNLTTICNEVFAEDNHINTITLNMSNMSGPKVQHAINGKRFPKIKEYILLYCKNNQKYKLNIPKEKKTDWDPEYNLIIPELKRGQIQSLYEMDCANADRIVSALSIESLNSYMNNNKIEDDVDNSWKRNNSYRIFASKPNTALLNIASNNHFVSPLAFLQNSSGQSKLIKTDFNRQTRTARIELVNAEINSSSFLGDHWTDIVTTGGIGQEGEVPFENGKKPLKLLRRIISVNIKNEDIVLDFFSGSATTAHAVMQLNAEDGGNRKFIMVQLPEETAEDSEAYKAGYKNICEIGKERIRRAGKKIKADSPLTTQDLDIGFRVLKCDESNYKPVAFAPKDYTQESLDMFLDNIKEERTGLDLLFDCMMRWGLELSLPYETQKVDGCTIYNVDDGNLVACFDGVVTSAVIDAIAETHPLRVVFRDSSFTEAAQKMNLFELFKQKCGWTDQEVQNNVRVI